MPEVISHAERELAAKVADRAMIGGWENAVKWAMREYDIPEYRVEQILDDAFEYNEKADPQGRIPELEDWANLPRSERARRS